MAMSLAQEAEKRAEGSWDHLVLARWHARYGDRTKGRQLMQVAENSAGDCEYHVQLIADTWKSWFNDHAQASRLLNETKGAFREWGEQ